MSGVLVPQYVGAVDRYSQPAVFGELVFMFWLLIKGAKPTAEVAEVTSA